MARLQRVPRRVVSSLRYRIDAPIVVYQMGKVGSSAVHRALSDLALPVPVHHVHLLTDFDAIERSVRASYAQPSTTLKQLALGRDLREKIDREPQTRWNVITLVRDPVARNVSAFFESIDELVPAAREGTTVAELGRVFLETFRHDAPLVWFQNQLTPVFGIDAYATPFPHRDGYQILEGDRARLLIVRNEDLADCFSDALQAFLGIRLRRLPTVNRSESKWYAALLRAFQDEFRLPDDYLDAMYGSTYAEHFYTDDERRRFEARYR